jgi:hypothetical protein
MTMDDFKMPTRAPKPKPKPSEPEKFKPVLSIDPGTPFGWAVWEEAAKPSTVGVWRQGKTEGDFMAWLANTHKAAIQLRQLIGMFGIEVVVCEFPAFWEENAAALSGSLVKLTFLVGRFAEVAQEERSKTILFKPMQVRTWRGQLPDEAVKRRVQRYLNGDPITDSIKSHAWDAVGIGWYYIHGHF